MPFEKRTINGIEYRVGQRVKLSARGERCFSNLRARGADKGVIVFIPESTLLKIWVRQDGLTPRGVPYVSRGSEYSASYWIPDESASGESGSS